MKIRILLLSSLILSSLVRAQDKDAMLWTGFSGDMDITKELSVELESQTRFQSNMSQYQQAYGELGVNYKLAKGLKFGATYRYSRKNAGDFYFNENRLCANLRYRYKLDMGLSLAARLRYQHSFDRLSMVNNIYPNRKNIMRLSFKIDYKNKAIKRFLPFIGGELFHALQPQNQYSYGWLDTYRLKAGLTLDLPDRHSVKIYYIFEHEYRASDNLNHIYCVQYNYSIKPLYKLKKKKDKEKL
jgi:hypothetical protein